MYTLLLRALKAQLVLLLTGMVFFTIGCEDDHDDDHDEHIDADGFVLEDENGTEIYREFEGATEGTITLNVGDEIELSVHFLDHDGDEVEHDEEKEEEHELRISGNDAGVATVEVEEHEDGHDDHHEMAIHVTGVSAGTTSFKLELMHDGHADYTSTNNVPIVVN